MSNTSAETDREGQATSQVQAAAENVQQKAVELKEQGRSKLGDTLDERTTQVGGQARQMAQALRRSSEQLRTSGESRQAAGVAESAADRIEQLGGYLERANGDELLRDVEHFARRRPWMIAGIGLVAGLAASRFLKASSERRYDTSQQSPHSPSRSRYAYDRYEAAAVGADDPISRQPVTSGERRVQ